MALNGITSMVACGCGNADGPRTFCRLIDRASLDDLIHHDVVAGILHAPTTPRVIFTNRGKLVRSNTHGRCWTVLEAELSAESARLGPREQPHECGRKF